MERLLGVRSSASAGETVEPCSVDTGQRVVRSHTNHSLQLDAGNRAKCLQLRWCTTGGLAWAWGVRLTWSLRSWPNKSGAEDRGLKREGPAERRCLVHSESATKARASVRGRKVRQALRVA